jgi:hypothetical protein
VVVAEMAAMAVVLEVAVGGPHVLPGPGAPLALVAAAVPVMGAEAVVSVLAVAVVAVL